MDYSTLFITIKGYIENDFPDTVFYGSDGTTVTTLTSVEQINTFIELAEERIYNSVQIPAIRKNQTGYMTSGNKYLSLPSDWLATFSLAVINPTTSAQSFLLNKDVNVFFVIFNFRLFSINKKGHNTVMSLQFFLI